MNKIEIINSPEFKELVAEFVDSVVTDYDITKRFNAFLDRKNNEFNLEEKRKKKKLFTTEDGVDIYEGDQYVRLNLETWWFRKDESTIAHSSTPAPDYYLHNKEFSTIAAAKEYIIMNKPCLSIKDIENYIFGGPEEGEFLRVYPLIDYLKNLAKSKL